VNALDQRDRALWGTAFYAGLRLGELRGLRWEDVNLAEGVIRVERAIEKKEGGDRAEVAGQVADGFRSGPSSGICSSSTG
jgi:integrase